MSYVLVLVAANMYLLLHCSSFLTAFHVGNPPAAKLGRWTGDSKEERKRSRSRCLAWQQLSSNARYGGEIPRIGTGEVLEIDL